MTSERILAVPTNVITGFLGAGKTSAILNFLEQKPADERWAVLINEFGEIGVDGSLVQGQAKEERGVFIKEVPGGCMCCTAGLSMQIALNQLLQRARPNRLLIEPTGLGHPVEVLQSLSAEHYRDVLSLQKTLTLIDARNLADDRYRDHPTFVQQLQIADVVVANKEDLYSAVDRDALEQFVAAHCHPNVDVLVTRQGRVMLDRLEGAPASAYDGREAHGHADQPLAADLPIPDTGFLTAVNQGEGFESVGWRFSPGKTFNRDRLYSFLSGLAVERMKAVFITGAGVFGYNLTRDALTEVSIDECCESRIEIISDSVDPQWEAQLMACLD